MTTQISNSSFLEKRDIRIILIRDNNTKDLGPIKQLDYQLPNTKKITQKIHPGQTAIITCYSESTCVIDNQEDTDTIPKPRRIALIIGKVRDNEGAEGMIRIVQKASKQAKQILAIETNIELDTESQEKMYRMIHFPKNYDHNLARKITEYVWCKSKSPILIAAKNKTRNNGPKKDIDKNKVIIMKSSLVGKTYAEALRELKEKVNIEKHEVLINKATKTAKGDLKLQIIEKTKGAEKTLGDEIKEATNLETTIQNKNRPTRLIIKNLETDTTVKDIGEAINKLIELSYPTELTISEPRTNGVGIRTAIITMNRADSIKLINYHRIKIGWTSCVIIELTQLYKLHESWAYTYELQETQSNRNSLPQM